MDIKNYSRENIGWKDFIATNKKFIWNFLNDGYKSAGYDGFYGCYDERSLSRNTCQVTFVEDNNKIVAVSVYTDYQEGKKCVGISKTTDPKLSRAGSEGVKKIIRRDIGLYSDFYWCECSGAIEHLYEKYHGIKIPVEYAPMILGKKQISFIEGDDYHYTREINGEQETKIIFGFNSKDTYNLVIEKYREYVKESTKWIDEHQDLLESDDSELSKQIKKAKGVVKIFVGMRIEDGVYEFPDDCLSLLKDNIDFLENVIEKNICPDELKHSVNVMIDYGKDVYDSSTSLEINKL